MNSAAVFLDRDNTLIEDPGYLADHTQVTLLPEAGETVRRWNEAGFRVVVATNQSGLARGLITEEQLDNIHTQLRRLLEQFGATLDAIYFCPYLEGPEAVVPKYSRASDLRKPLPGMLHQAAEELQLDLEASWMVGDSITDVQAGLAAGCRTILLANPDDPPQETDADFIVDSLSQAADVVLREAAFVRAPGSAEMPEEADRPPPTAPPETENVALLRDIRALLQQQCREDTQSDFSLARLGATLFQFVAIAILLWGLAAFVSDRLDAALVRFVLAGVVQLGSLTLLLMDRTR